MTELTKKAREGLKILSAVSMLKKLRTILVFFFFFFLEAFSIKKVITQTDFQDMSLVRIY